MLFWLLPSLVILLLYVLVEWADAWLESPGGRKLLQRELGKGLGLPVTLQGEYGLRLFPRLEIAGAGLVVGERPGDSVFLYGRNFSAEVELLPLFNRQVRVASIGISEGFIDLANLPSPVGLPSGAGAATATAPVTLPDVASLEVENFSVRYADSPYRLDIGEMVLGGFQAGTPASLTLKAALMSGETMRAATNLRGSLLVEPADLSTGLHIEHMEIALDGVHIGGITADGRWDRRTGRVDGQVGWRDASQSANVRFGLAADDPVSAALQGEYRSDVLLAPITLAVESRFLPGSVALDSVVLALDSQRIDGSGCIRFDELAGLHLDLAADELDLDALAPVFPEGQGEAADLSFVRAMRLRVRTARLSGALAEDVLVQAGTEPACASAEGALP